MVCDGTTAERIAELLLQLGRAAGSEQACSALTAAQWTCLRFFARANDSTRTPSAFAHFHATTRGTASQIIKSLERRGLMRRARSAHDGRSVCFDLTDEGRSVLRDDPLGTLIGVVESLAPDEAGRCLDTLSVIACGLACCRRAPAFGTCENCRHFTGSDGGPYCLSMASAVAMTDIRKICASYEPSPDPGSLGERHGAA